MGRLLYVLSDQSELSAVATTGKIIVSISNQEGPTVLV